MVRGVKRGLGFSIGVGVLVVALPSAARADDPSYGLPQPRLVPELSLSKDKGVESVQENSWETRKKQVSIMGGSPGSPLGVVALGLEYAPTKYTVIGVGGGYAPDGGLRGSLMPRLRLPLNRWFAVGFGFPFTLGPYEYSQHIPEQCQFAGCSTGYRTTRSWPIAFWGQLEPNVEVRLGNSGVALRVFGGYARVLNDQSDRCTSTLAHGCPSQIGDQKWYGGLAAGYAW
jgi:hypothetical protein